MATLTELESKLAEVLGLAMASQEAVDTVRDMLDDDEHGLTATLEQMRDAARETQKRVTEIAGIFDRKKTAILATAKETTRSTASSSSPWPKPARSVTG